MALQEEFEKQGIWLFRYRSYLPLLVLIIGIAIFAQTKLYNKSSVINNDSWEHLFEYICLLISLIGLFIRIYTVGHTPQNTSGRNTSAGQVADTLNTTGMYSIVRHPLYLGNFLMWLGIALLTGNIWFTVAFCFLYWLYYERIMFAEEQFLRKKFEGEYLKWAEIAPPVIPNFKNFQKPNICFSWKKVLKKEKNGLFALFLIFTLFDVLGEVIERERNFNYGLILFCLLTGVSYIVLKYLKMKTTILNEINR